ncbi:unnamed protein product [Ixodes persulcatus]
METTGVKENGKTRTTMKHQQSQVRKKRKGPRKVPSTVASPARQQPPPHAP